VSPSEYCKRFLKFMADNIIQDREGDYANKGLPGIPEDYAVEDAEDEFDTVVVNSKPLT